MFEFHFKIVRTEVTCAYSIHTESTVAEFIEKMKHNLAVNPDFANIQEFELVPLTDSVLDAEDGPALEPSDQPLSTIWNENSDSTFLYIRPIVAPAISAGVETSGHLEPVTRLCVVCHSSPRHIAFAPCGHLCICRDCSNNPSITTCPICRNSFTRMLEIFDP